MHSLRLRYTEEGHLGANRSSVKNSCAIAVQNTTRGVGVCSVLFYSIKSFVKTTKELKEIAERDASIPKD